MCPDLGCRHSRRGAHALECASFSGREVARRIPAVDLDVRRAERHVRTEAPLPPGRSLQLRRNRRACRSRAVPRPPDPARSFTLKIMTVDSSLRGAILMITFASIALAQQPPLPPLK